jgi:hypothetical protein
MNFINEVDNPKVTKTIVVYAGRFQPFHRGHYDAYKRLVSKFGEDSVYIGTSNDTSGPKSPFNFNEKKKIATTMFGVPTSKFVQIRNPYKPTEILSKFDGKTTQYIAAVGEKDATRLQGKYFKAYKGKAGYGYDEIGYVYTVPPEPNPISGTDVRNNLGGDDIEKAKKFFLVAYPKFNQKIFDMITKRIRGLNEYGSLRGSGMAGDFGPSPTKKSDDEEISEDGLPGGAFTGLVSPGGYINGAPKPKDVAKLSKKLHKKDDEDSHEKYVYNPISELVSKLISEDEFNKFVQNYIGESESKVTDKQNISKSKVQSIADFVEYSTKRLKLKDKPKIKLILGSEYSQQNSSLGGYSPETKDIVVVVPKRMTADICRTIAHELVHRKQDEMGLVRNSAEAGKTGSPVENQANAIAGILLRDYGKKNKQIYAEGTIITEVSALSVSDADRPDGAYLPKGAKRKLGANDGVNLSDHWFHNGGYIQLEFPEADQILGDDDANQIIVKYVTKNVPRMTGEPTKFTKNPEKAKMINEMSRNDIHFKNIFQHWRDGDAKEKQKIAYVITGNKFAKSKEIVKALMELDYDEIAELEDELKISPFDEHSEAGGWVGPNAGGWVKDDEEMYNEWHTAQNHKPVSKADSDFTKNHARDIGIPAELDTYDFDDRREKKPGNQPNTKDDEDFGYEPVKREDINVKVDKGDDVLMGKFKNKRVTVKDIGTDKHGMPTINGKQATTFRTINEIKQNIEETKQLIMEGGAYGHMSHPFDDMNLTFGDLKDIIGKALDGELGVVREKTDGQALAISWKNGRLIAARNKGHLANAGANAMGIEDVAAKFANRGGLTDAYNFAMRDLTAAIGGLSEKQKEKIFQNGKCFMNLEVIWPTSVNVIPYGQALLVFHNTTCYDETGVAIAADQTSARTLAGMIKQINADIQSKYTIQGPPVTEIPKSKELSSKKTKYLSKLSKLQSQFGLSDADTVSLYHQSWWENFIDTKAPVKVDKMTKEALVRRWAFGDKSFKINTISNPELKKWADDNDKVNVVKQQKDNIKPFEEIFLGVGADVLEFVGSVLTVHPDKAIRNMKQRLVATADQVRTAGSATQIQKLKTELGRLNQLGGIDRIVASEGLVFFYNGKTYKLTGTFAPLNQILGIFYE